MFAVKVLHNFLDDRLDAGFYRPDFLRMDRTLKEFGAVKLGSLVRSVACGPFGGNAIADDLYAPEGIAFIRPVNISSHVFDDSSLVRVPEKNLLANGLKVYQGTNLYFGRVGDPCVAVITGETSISPNIIIANTDDEIADAHFIYAFTASKYGINQLLRQLKTVAQPTTSTDAIRDLLVIKPADGVQKYIGDKVRQAERLRFWAKELSEDVDVVLDKFNLPTSESPAMVNRVSTTRLDARLDPRPYRTHYIALVDRIKEIENSRVIEVADLASGCPVSSNDFVEAGEVPLVRIRNIGFDEFIDLDTGVTKSLHADEAKYQAKENMIVLGMDGIFRAQFFLNDELPMLVNQRVAMLNTSDIRAELLTHWLNRPEGQMQLNQWAVKTTVEHTSLSDIGRVLIPRLDRNAEDGLAEKLLSARQAYRYSRFLTTCAKFLVEALIEGQLSEGELIAAEQALQTGNDQPDRRILNRLKTDGIDGQGQALFSDLDQLFSLVEQASHS